jgi:hypothetical protein
VEGTGTDLVENRGYLIPIKPSCPYTPTRMSVIILITQTGIFLPSTPHKSMNDLCMVASGWLDQNGYIQTFSQADIHHTW